MKYISCSPDELYYAWQVEVMLDNFLSVGIDPMDIHIVVGIQKHIGLWWGKLIQKYQNVGFFFYTDTRNMRDYPPSIRPHILMKHWNRYPELIFETIFYHDCDIVFTSKPDFTRFVDDDVWYLSDTISYIGAEYIISKGRNIYEKMTDSIGIKRSIPIANQKSSGGAQYIIKNVTRPFWGHVYMCSELLYNCLNDIDSDIQKWTADMWAFLWTAWNFEYKTKIDPYLNFSMATDTWPSWDKNLIYHNAGAVPEHEGILFRKDQFRDNLPYTDANPYNNDFCSYYYFDQVIKTGRSSCLVPKDEYPDLLEKTKSIFI